MSKYILKSNGSEMVQVPAFRDDGVFDIEAFVARAREIGVSIQNEETVGVEGMLANISTALIGMPTKRNMTEADLELILWNRKVRAGDVPEDPDLAKEMHEVHSATLSHVLRNRPGQFFVGQGAGVLIRYVDGDDSGDFDNGGNPIPKKRYSDEEWTKFVAAGKVAAEKKAAKAAQKSAGASA